jgi:signal transduction histidine kinase
VDPRDADESTVTEVLLFRSDIRHEQDVVLVRQRARQLAGLLGFDVQEQTRVATSVSEIARNAFEYAGGGRAAFLVDTDRRSTYFVRISDSGHGIADLAAILEGRYISPSGMGVGMSGARRLVDHFDVVTGKDGTTVTLGKLIPQGSALNPARLQEIIQTLIASVPHDPMSELQSQNHELLRAMDEVLARQREVERLNAELAETNRGVLALYAELDDRALQLARASELKSRFLSNISHELRTPLNAIQNLTRVLLDRMDGNLTEEQDRQVTLIRSAAVTLTEMVNDLLDLAKIEAGKTVLRLTDFSVADLLGGLRGMVRPLVTSPNVTLVIDQPNWDWWMHSDEGKVSQILRNLVSNAVKFTEEGEIRVTASFHADQATFHFQVSDTGIGIAAEHLERIFEDYSQVEHTLQQKTIGTGLGLPLSRRLAELLGGELTVASDIGRGSTFTLCVPQRCQETSSDDGSIGNQAEGSIQHV